MSTDLQEMEETWGPLEKAGRGRAGYESPEAEAHSRHSEAAIVVGSLSNVSLGEGLRENKEPDHSWCCRQLCGMCLLI